MITIEDFFSDYLEIQLVAYKLKGGSSVWWEQLHYNRKWLDIVFAHAAVGIQVRVPTDQAVNFSNDRVS